MNLGVRFLRFAGVGGVSTVLQYAILAILVSLLSLDPVMASSVGYLLSALVNYHLNHVYTYRSISSYRRGLPRFFLILGIGLALNGAVLDFAISIFQWHYVVGQLLATVLTLVWNFAANHRWTFTPSRAP